MNATVSTVAFIYATFPCSQYNADECVELYLHVYYTCHVMVFIWYSSGVAFDQVGGV